MSEAKINTPHLPPIKIRPKAQFIVKA